MKSRQRNKLFQMMRVSKFFFKHKHITGGAPSTKKVIKQFNDKLDDLLVNVLKQKEDITGVTRNIDLLRENLMQATLKASKLSAVYLVDVNTPDYSGINVTYTHLKGLTKNDLHSRCANIYRIIKKYEREVKSYGLKEKDLTLFGDLLLKWNSTMIMPRVAIGARKHITQKIFDGLNELNNMQWEKLDNIASCLIETGTLKEEYRKARKYVRHKNPEGLFDEMLKSYRGVRKNPLKVKIKKELVLV